MKTQALIALLAVAPFAAFAGNNADHADHAKDTTVAAPAAEEVSGTEAMDAGAEAPATKEAK